MTLKELLDKIQKAIPADGDAAMRQDIADAIRQATVMTDSLSAANKESESRRNKINELQTKLDAQTAEIAGLNAAKDSDEYKSLRAKADKYDALMTEKATQTVNDWKAAQTKLDAIQSTDKRHSKVEAFRKTLTLPQEGKELDAETAKRNLDLFTAFEAGGGLDTNVADGQNPPGGKPGDPTPMTSGDAVLTILQQQNK